MRLALAATLLMLAASCLAADAADRKFIKEGMTEGEVVLMIGEPDRETIESGPEARVVVRRWTYYPNPDDPQTLTVLTLRGAVVSFVERTISRRTGR